MNPLRGVADLFQAIGEGLGNFTQSAGKQTSQDKADIDFKFDRLLDFINKAMANK